MAMTPPAVKSSKKLLKLVTLPTEAEHAFNQVQGLLRPCWQPTLPLSGWELFLLVLSAQDLRSQAAGDNQGCPCPAQMAPPLAQQGVRKGRAQHRLHGVDDGRVCGGHIMQRNHLQATAMLDASCNAEPWLSI